MLAQRLHALACQADCLPEPAQERLLAAIASAEAALALAALVELLDPDGGRSCWATAGEVSWRLSRRQRRARPPRDEVERLLDVLLADEGFPQSQRRITDALRLLKGM